MVRRGSTVRVPSESFGLNIGFALHLGPSFERHRAVWEGVGKVRLLQALVGLAQSRRCAVLTCISSRTYRLATLSSSAPIMHLRGIDP
jgi:hypothetical protein